MPFLPEDPEREQRLLDLVRTESEAAAEHAARHVSKRATIGFVILAIGLILTVFVGGQRIQDLGRTQRNAIKNTALESTAQAKRAGEVVTIQGCNRDFKSTEKIRALLIRLKQANDISFQMGRITAAQHKVAADFYLDQLKRINLPDCRESIEAFNTNVDSLRPLPQPLYPGAPGTDDAG